MTVDQTSFRTALLDPGVEHPAGLRDGQDRVAGRRFNVYRNNVAASLTEALEAAFPVVRKLIGEQNFKVLAVQFLRQHPPQSPLMMFYGAEMPAFLAAFEQTASIAYLPDVARLEMAIRESYHAQDAEAVSAEVLQALPPEQLMAARLGVAPSLRLIRSDWPIYSIWAFNTFDDAPKPVMAGEDILVLRPELDPEPHLLTAGSAVFIEEIQKGAAFGQAFEAASAAAPNFDLTAMLALLISSGAIIEIGD